MKILILCLVIFSALTSCTSVKKYNEQISRPLTVKQLKSDVDFMAGKLKKLHPDQYWYISKSELDGKFDSLKASISGPMTSNEFFLRVSSVSSSVRQG
ncbi:MAG: peptidase S41, partial [Bacteroidota bacterium]|nr:peptidase S41 [Bacteroidota bacterium]